LNFNLALVGIALTDKISYQSMACFAVPSFGFVLPLFSCCCFCDFYARALERFPFRYFNISIPPSAICTALFGGLLVVLAVFWHFLWCECATHHPPAVSVGSVGQQRHVCDSRNPQEPVASCNLLLLRVRLGPISVSFAISLSFRWKNKEKGEKSVHI